MVIRIAWLPILIVLLFYGGALFALGGAGLNAVDITGSDPEEAFAAAFANGGFITGYVFLSTLAPLATMLILSCVYVAVIRASTFAFFEPPSLPFYFALGPRELRYFATQFFYGMIIAISAMVMVAVVAGVIGLTAVASQAIDGRASALIIAPGAFAAIWVFLVWLWIILRLLPVLPIAAVENRISFGDAWKMTKGQFWRLLLSGAMFVSILQSVIFILFFIFFIPAGIMIGLLALAGFGVVGPVAFVLFAFLALLLVPAVIALVSFGLAAEAAFPARVYAYLSDCGDDCRIY